MSSAIVEAAGLKGSKLYASRYVEPAMQEGGQVTYTPNAAVTAQIQAYADPDGNGLIDNPENFINLVEEAEEILQARYSEAAKRARNEYLQKSVDTAIQNEEYLENIQDKSEIDIGTALTNRKQYLETLN